MVQDDALVCRHCHHRFSDEELANAQAEQKRSGILKAVLIVAAIVLAGAWLNNGGAERLGEWAAGVEAR